MDNRREFIKKAALLSGGAGLAGKLPASVQKAFGINPPPGSTYLDAEHIVILMQENRSFDHCYGTLQGVRGYNDPRAIIKPDENLVWLQKNAGGETYAPFRLNIKDSNATWLGSLPHSWTNQVDAGNGGKHDKWLLAKPSGHKGFAKVPLTMGYYNREDLPFYYSLADAFTVCDQNFCSSLTGTTPNRLYLWTGTVRPEQHKDSFAHVRNEDVDHFKPASWPTFPERLEDNNISWKIYQNEISLASGLDNDQDAWLSNFTDNPIEFFSQYNIQFAESYRKHIKELLVSLPPEIADLQGSLKTAAPDSDEHKKMQKALDDKQVWLARAKEGIDKYTAENFEKLPQRNKKLHQKAFSINDTDPHYRSLDTLRYSEGDTKREMKVPKGDVLHRFRQDVDNNRLPVVSWIVGPENFSDHPGAPWYGAWYVAEVLDILTRRPEVWKKTIFILCYDENDGYFDHVPPFVAPDPDDRQSGKTSDGIDTSVEFVTMEQDMTKYDKAHARKSAIGLGYRVPLVIASPWSRGGAVCSQVFDHTSILQFLENFINKKFNKNIQETNISSWRRTVCGDLSAVFKPYNADKTPGPVFPEKNIFIESIHNARFRKDPSGYKPLTNEEIEHTNKRQLHNTVMPAQEKGIRPSCALPYELYSDSALSTDKKSVVIQFRAANEIFGKKSAGSPFQVYAGSGDAIKIRSYAVTAGDRITDEWPLDEFADGHYQLSLHGPNGFFRLFRGDASDPLVNITVGYERVKSGASQLSGNIIIKATATGDHATQIIEISDNAYGSAPKKMRLDAKTKQAAVTLDLSGSHAWYDFTVRIAGNKRFEKRYAGRVETGKQGFTDPFMGGTV